MIFKETNLKGAYSIELEPIYDERGFFSRSFCRDAFTEHGMNPQIAQCNISFNKKKGTLRGMHYQMAPHAEAKLVRCLRGAVYDVIIDLRQDSPTYGRWTGIELRAFEPAAFPCVHLLYIPEGFAHGFQTLDESTEVFYQMSESHHPASARGVRWNDPIFAIQWPLEPVISEKDQSYPDFVL
jgi:dTDP-4-dehydrorhamnose 3,5-epimerase